MTGAELLTRYDDVSDNAIVARVVAGETALFEVLMRRHNQRLFRAARSILKNDAEAEDALQEAYINAFTHLASFEGRASVVTWLTRITVHEAFARIRRAKREPKSAGDAALAEDVLEVDFEQLDPERTASERELCALLEEAVDALPEVYRTVLVLRAIEQLSVAETAACLEIPEDTVKTRLFRARKALTDQLQTRTAMSLPNLFSFGFERCDRIVAGVLRQLPG